MRHSEGTGTDPPPPPQKKGILEQNSSFAISAISISVSGPRTLGEGQCSVVVTLLTGRAPHSHDAAAAVGPSSQGLWLLTRCQTRMPAEESRTTRSQTWLQRERPLVWTMAFSKVTPREFTVLRTSLPLGRPERPPHVGSGRPGVVTGCGTYPRHSCTPLGTSTNMCM